MHSPVEEHVGDDADAETGIGRAKEPFGVVGRGRFGDRADPLEHRPVCELGREVMGDQHPARSRVALVLVFEARLPEVPGGADAEICQRELSEDAELGRELRRPVEIVAVEEREVVAPRLPDPVVSRRRGSGVRLAEQAYRVAVRLGEDGGSIGRPVVDDEHLDRPVILGEDRLDRAGEELFAVPDRDDARDERRHRPRLLEEAAEPGVDLHGEGATALLAAHRNPWDRVGAAEIVSLGCETRPEAGAASARPDGLVVRAERVGEIEHLGSGELREPEPALDELRQPLVGLERPQIDMPDAVRTELPAPRRDGGPQLAAIGHRQPSDRELGLVPVVRPSDVPPGDEEDGRLAALGQHRSDRLDHMRVGIVEGQKQRKWVVAPGMELVQRERPESPSFELGELPRELLGLDEEGAALGRDVGRDGNDRVVEKREPHGAYPHTMREGTFSVGGMPMRVRCAGALHWEQLEGALLPANGAALTLDSCAFDLWDSEESGISPEVDGWPEEAELRQGGHGEALGFLPGGELRYAGPDFDLRLDRHRRTVVGWVAASRLPPWHRLRPWQALLIPALADAGVETVHASMVARGDRGVLLPGPNGSGKSTTAVACLAAGLELLGDDAIAVDESGRGHTIHAVAKLSRAGLARHPALEALSERYDDPAEDERWIRLRALGPARATPSATIGALAFPRIVDRDESLVTAMRPAKAASELLRNALSATPERIAGCFATLTALATSVPAYGLEVGRDQDSLAAAVTALL